MRETRPRPCKQPMTTTRDGRERRRRPNSSTGDAKLVCSSEHLTATSSTDASSTLQPAKVTSTRFVVGTASFSEDEDDLLIKLHALLGNRWSIIAGRLPGRTAEEVKAHWDSPVMAVKLMRPNYDNHCMILQALIASPDGHGEHRGSAVQNKREEHPVHPSSPRDDSDAVSDDGAASDAGSSNI
ncbi:hypothetical protein ACQ4PT_053511 [Festuca glaucescens]